jgi:hypothetical protein
MLPELDPHEAAGEEFERGSERFNPVVDVLRKGD